MTYDEKFCKKILFADKAGVGNLYTILVWSGIWVNFGPQLHKLHPHRSFMCLKTELPLL